MAPTDPSITTQNPTAAAQEPQDLSQYIRTYAKDVATLSGKGNIGAVQRPKQTTNAVTDERRTTVTDGVEFDPTSQPYTEPDIASLKNPNAPLEVESREDLSSFMQSATPPAKDAAAAREGILARLRASQGVAQAPVFETPPVEPAHAMPPLYREPLPEPIPVAAPPPPRIPLPEKKPETPPPFHSFATDFRARSEAVSNSPFSVIAAEQDADKRVRRTPSLNKKGIVPIVLGMVLIVAAAGGSYALYVYIGARHVVPTVVLHVPSLIFAEQYKKVTGTGGDLLQSLAMVASDPVDTGTAIVTYVEQPVTGQTGIVAGAPAPGGVLIKELSLPAPDLLLRNVTQDSTVGVIHEGGDTRAFFILRVSSYERTFAGMLTWEPLMARDLSLLYPLYPSDPAEQPSVRLDTASTTASSTPASAPPVQGPATSRERFEDAVVANRDVRILRDTRGRSIMLYGYADKETLIIARSESAFSALLVRLAAGNK